MSGRFILFDSITCIFFLYIHFFFVGYSEMAKCPLIAAFIADDFTCKNILFGCNSFVMSVIGLSRRNRHEIGTWE